ncbi:MAG TPA: type II toxin-antitoxin system VapC family toxin [Micropepsaceae bacterium]|nr:type II toxin-antitoxin system VapC family toxin [Micropepsaceae bacterium]
MKLVDTSAWIEWLTDTPLGRKIGAELPKPGQWLVPTLVQLELSKWLTGNADEDRAELVLAFSTTCVVVPLDTEIALAAADLCRQHQLSTADSIIYATARAFDAVLVTCDAHFNSLADVKYFPKGKS